MSFHSMQTNPCDYYYAGDLNHDLYCFWNELKNTTDLMLREIVRLRETETDGKALFQRLLLKRTGEMTALERAVDFFVLNRITFSGLVDSGGYSNHAFGNRFTWSSIKRLSDIYQLVRNIEFTHTDYTDLLFREGKDVFIFLDPPYHAAIKSRLYGKKGCLHTGFRHDEFADNLKQCKHKWLLTYDDSATIRHLFRDYQQIGLESVYSMSNSGKSKTKKGKELIIMN